MIVMRKVFGGILLAVAVSSLLQALLYCSPLFIDQSPFEARLGEGKRITLVSPDGEVLATGTVDGFQQARSRYPVRDTTPLRSLAFLVLAAICSWAVPRLLPKWRLWYGIACVVFSVGLLNLRGSFLALKIREATVSDEAVVTVVRTSGSGTHRLFSFSQPYPY